MIRRTLTVAGLCAGLLLSATALGASLGNLTQQDAGGGLRDALTQGAQVAVAQLAVPGGFSNNPEVRIELPGKLGKAAKTMKKFGMGAQVDALETSMNQAAEAAMPQAQALLVDAVKKMTLTDAKGILTGRQGFGHPVFEQDQPRTDPHQVLAYRQAGHRPGRCGAEVQQFCRPSGELGRA